MILLSGTEFIESKKSNLTGEGKPSKRGGGDDLPGADVLQLQEVSTSIWDLFSLVLDIIFNTLRFGEHVCPGYEETA